MPRTPARHLSNAPRAPAWVLDVNRRGEIVLDPFLRSGSTLIACERVGRRCFGIELDARYADAALRRWRSYTGEEPVHAATGLPLGTLEAQFMNTAQASRIGEAE